ncbi:MAG: hypothetical protein ACLUNZ_12525 [Evtepia sp.]
MDFDGKYLRHDIGQRRWRLWRTETHILMSAQPAPGGHTMVRRIYVEKKPGLRQEARAALHELQTVVGVSRLGGPAPAEPLLTWRAWTRPPSAGRWGQCSLSLRWTMPPQPCPRGLHRLRRGAPAGTVRPAGGLRRPVYSADDSGASGPRSAPPGSICSSVPLTAADVDAVKRYVLNPVECREAALGPPETLARDRDVPADVATLTRLHWPWTEAGLDTAAGAAGPRHGPGRPVVPPGILPGHGATGTPP